MSGERWSPELGEVSPVLLDRTGQEWCVLELLAVCAPQHYGMGEGGVLSVEWMFKIVCLSFASIRMSCLHVKSYDIFMWKKIDTTCSLFARTFLTVASRDKRWSISVRLALPPHFSVHSVPF